MMFPFKDKFFAFWSKFLKFYLRVPSQFKHVSFIAISFFLALFVFTSSIISVQKLISPLTSDSKNLQSLRIGKNGYEVFGFAPYWTFNKLDNVDFNTLTTFAYFGVPVDELGNLDKEGTGYQTFISPKATQIFQKAHTSQTRVVLTLTQMSNDPIEQLMDNPQAQTNLINSAVAEVKNRGIDGVNIDFEYVGNPGPEYRQKFSLFVKNMTYAMHQGIPSSQVSVSVYASAIKDPKIYDIAALGRNADKIFMMAYDFGVAGSDNVIPTAPLYGYKEGKYWYDVSTAVEAFLTQMPSKKLILGVPWYGYNYPIEGEPAAKAATNKGYYAYYKKGWRTYSYFVPVYSNAQTYSKVQSQITDNSSTFSSFKTGWDDLGQVGWKAYNNGDGWRMIFIDDPKSLGLKYDFAKNKNLAGVGMWALGFDDGQTELWDLLSEKFGQKDLAENIFNANQNQ